MEKNIYDPALDRIHARAITAGVTTTFGTMLLLLMGEGAITGWNLNLEYFREASIGFWSASLAAWIVSVYLGSRLAVTAAGVSRYRDAFVQTITTWAASTVLASMVLALATGRLLNFSFSHSSSLLWLAFLGNALALVAAIRAARVESRSEAMAIVRDTPQVSESQRAEGLRSA